MRSLLALLTMAFTCAPAAAPDSPGAPRPTAAPSQATPKLALAIAPTPPPPTTQLVVPLPTDGDPWISQARDDWELSSEDLRELLVPPLEDFPDDDLAVAFAHALRTDVADCDEVDHDEAWAAVAAEVEAAGLSTEAPGTAGSPFDRYATLWLLYVQADGFFMDEADRAAIENGLLDSLDEVSDGPLRDPLILAAVLMHPEEEDERVLDLVWELVEEHDEPMAVVGMEVLLDAGEPLGAFDPLSFSPDSELQLRRRRLHLEQAAADAASLDVAAEALLAHPVAAPSDRRDVHQLTLRAEAAQPVSSWARALVADAGACADLAAGDEVRLVVRDPTWTTDGQGSVADCLFGWSWPEVVPDQDVVLTVVR